MKLIFPTNWLGFIVLGQGLFSLAVDIYGKDRNNRLHLHSLFSDGRENCKLIKTITKDIMSISLKLKRNNAVAENKTTANEALTTELGKAQAGEPRIATYADDGDGVGILFGISAGDGAYAIFDNHFKTIDGETIVGDGNIDIRSAIDAIDAKVGSNDYSGATYISKETNLTDAVVQLDEEIKATNGNLALEHTNAEATYAKKTELDKYLLRSGGEITGPIYSGSKTGLVNDSEDNLITAIYKFLAREEGYETGNIATYFTSTFQIIPGEGIVILEVKDGYEAYLTVYANGQVQTIAIMQSYSGGVRSTNGILINRAGISNDVNNPNALFATDGSTTTLKTVNGESLLGSGDITTPTPTVNAASGTKTIWTGTQSEYEGVSPKDTNTLYFITEE